MKRLHKDTFLQRYNIDQVAFDSLNLTWDQLVKIYQDYLKLREKLAPIANTIADILRKDPDIHTVKSRIKEPEHVIEKIIRKSLEKEDEEQPISIANYQEHITDLIGIRVLHLYKDQAADIDEFIQSTWALKEKVTIYYREGDSVASNAEQMEQYFDFKEHPAGYRSWHYLIQTNVQHGAAIAEVQVRSLFEEGWSEIDHQLRYHYDLSDSLLIDQLLVLNRIAGSADEMANTIRETKRGLDKLAHQNKEYKMQIEELSNDLERAVQDKMSNEQLVEDLQFKINKLMHYPLVSSVGLGSSRYKNMQPHSRADVNLSELKKTQKENKREK